MRLRSGCCAQKQNLEKINPKDGHRLFHTLVPYIDVHGVLQTTNSTAVRVEALRTTNDVLVGTIPITNDYAGTVSRVDSSGAIVWSTVAAPGGKGNGHQFRASRMFASDDLGNYILLTNTTGGVLMSCYAKTDLTQSSPLWTKTILAVVDGVVVRGTLGVVSYDANPSISAVATVEGFDTTTGATLWSFPASFSSTTFRVCPQAIDSSGKFAQIQTGTGSGLAPWLTQLDSSGSEINNNHQATSARFGPGGYSWVSGAAASFTSGLVGTNSALLVPSFAVTSVFGYSVLSWGWDTCSFNLSSAYSGPYFVFNGPEFGYLGPFPRTFSANIVCTDNAGNVVWTRYFGGDGPWGRITRETNGCAMSDDNFLYVAGDYISA